MTEKNAQLEAGLASDLNRELDAFKQENLLLKNTVTVLSTNLTKLSAENEDLKSSLFSRDFKRHWRLTFAGQAMNGQLSQLDSDEFDLNYKLIASQSFLAADAMIEFLEQDTKL